MTARLRDVGQRFQNRVIATRAAARADFNEHGYSHAAILETTHDLWKTPHYYNSIVEYKIKHRISIQTFYNERGCDASEKIV